MKKQVQIGESTHRPSWTSENVTGQLEAFKMKQHVKREVNKKALVLKGLK